MSTAKPYVNRAMLSSNVGQSVCVIGKVVSANTMQMELQLADGQNVKVQLEEQLEEQLDGYVQMIARVNRDCSLVCENLISFGVGEIDLDAYNNALDVMSRHQNLFSSNEVNGAVH